MKLALAVQTPEVPRPIPVALLSGSFPEKLARAAALGADGIELMTTDPRQLDAADIRSRVQQAGLEVAAIGSGAVAFATGLTLLHPDPDQAEQARTRLNQLIDFAAAVGSPLVTIGSFRGRLAAVGSGGRGRLLALLREGADYAASRDVRLALEPLNRYEADLILSVDEGLSVIDQVGHPALGLLVDTYHANIEECSWTEPLRRALAAGRLWHVHLGDNNRLPPGQGLIDFRAIVATLSRLGYSSYLSAELLAQPDPDTAAAQTLHYMRPLLAGNEP